jgi:hypothetical protein
MLANNSKSSVNYKNNPGETDISDSIRSLRKCDLGGVIFSCTHATIAECHLKQLFGNYAILLLKFEGYNNYCLLVLNNKHEGRNAF